MCTCTGHMTLPPGPQGALSQHARDGVPRFAQMFTKREKYCEGVGETDTGREGETTSDCSQYVLLDVVVVGWGSAGYHFDSPQEPRLARELAVLSVYLAICCCSRCLSVSAGPAGCESRVSAAPVIFRGLFSPRDFTADTRELTN
ncbi:hypothetical protein ElyMa_004370400 [Elysia marginata]|uniref:Uncharacterized protein n=1 Tax=Elysia marginata TaxID=1093978 RepID=A0AAV4H5Q1_9GAST|nr:hypothetical protein ElyMa_004370400 [Elysia marginata]